jgi:hydroxymethylglutaryl-CoA lyase
VDRIERALALADGEGMEIRTLLLADSMGWASPEQVRHTVGAIRERWPDHLIRLHLHDTRGMGLANAYAAMCEGVTEFDSSVAGLGGCPFGGDRGAAGNIATEDLVHMCAELGVETGVDLDRLLDVAHEAVGIVGHDLPGKVMKGGSLAAVRRGLLNRPNNGTC